MLDWIPKGGHPAAYHCSVSFVLTSGPFQIRFSEGYFLSCFDTVLRRRIMLACCFPVPEFSPSNLKSLTD